MSNIPPVKEYVSLKPYTSFGIEATARYFAAFSGEDELKQLLSNPVCSEVPALIMGGGSNILFTQDYQGLVLHNNIRGLEILEENEQSVVIRVGAGENWDELVGYCVRQGWAGLENLSYIPGQVGASPIQNIGAYGAEVKDTIKMVHTLNRHSLMPLTYSNADCEFDYRQSIFKKQLRGKRVITHVVFLLSKKPRYNLNYGTLNVTVRQKGAVNLTNIRQAVIDIRRQKLPEPDETGSAGSFFKNPVVDQNKYRKLVSNHPDLPSYKLNKKHYKIPAGWLIDQLGWKGYREGDAGVHPNQALVLVNYGNATGRQIYELATRIRKAVRDHFGIDLDYEVNIL